MEHLILKALARKNYVPVKPKALAKQVGIPGTQYADFRRALRDLAKSGKITFGRNHTIRPAEQAGTVVGIYRRLSSGRGIVRPHEPGKAASEIAIGEFDALDATTGDEVQVRLSKPDRGEIIRVLERAKRQFVGTYFERDGEALVRVDGGLFAHSVAVGDPGAKGAKSDDKVVFEMLRFPSPDDRGEGVITEVLGARGAPGVDTLSVIRAYELPDEFPPDVLEEARQAAEEFDESDLDGREDLTDRTIVTIDPATARDFDDAISLERDAKTGHWLLGVHIADVGHFAAPGSALDREAKRRGTSVYLPQRVLPMFPELISNGLASLQQGKLRYVKSAFIELTAEGQRIGTRFANAAIKTAKRFSYEQVMAFFEAHPRWRGGKDTQPLPRVGLAVDELLQGMRELALILRARRVKRGALELAMPEAELEYDDAGRVTGAHFVPYDVSHQVIEEFMLAANEAVAEHFTERGVAFLRRVHPAPDPLKLKAFAEFASILGYDLKKATDRFSLQRVLQKSAEKPERHAVHFALLRSLKQAVYSPDVEEHYALASANYCHFTSPIRRYPDLTVHRLLDQFIREGRAGSDPVELAGIGEHCTRTERRAEQAERDLVKLRLLTYLSTRIGLELDAVITGVADYGFFAQAETFPAEGLVHVSTLSDDYYAYDDESHTLEGRRSKKRYRLGDKVRVTVVRVDLNRRQLDFRVEGGGPEVIRPRRTARTKRRRG
ncbi:MAG: ribonuclease R [Gemmataceae bacterium]